MKMRKQRLMGVGLIVISWLVLLLACTESESPEDNDATAALLVTPLGLYMLYSDTYLLYDGEPEPRARDRPEALPARRDPTTLTTKGAATWQGKELSSPRVLRHGRTPTTPSGRSPRRRLPSGTLRAR